MNDIAETLFPLIGLPVSLLLLAIGGMMLWDILASYGRAVRPDALADRSRIVSWFLNQGRLGAESPPSSRRLMWWRLLIAWTLGGSMFVFWIREVLL